MTLVLEGESCDVSSRELCDVGFRGKLCGVGFREESCGVGFGGESV